MNKLKNLKAYSDEEIKSFKIPKDQLWLIYNGSEVFGPFLEDHLIQFLSQFPISKESDLQGSKLSESRWLPLSSIKIFSAQVQSTKYYILKAGRAEGPYDKNIIAALLKDQALARTDHLSGDGGLTWKKVYEFTDFDRRYQTRGKAKVGLPKIPSRDAFTSEQLEVFDQVQESSQEDQTNIFLLAKAKDNQEVSQAPFENFDQILVEQRKSNDFFKWSMVLVLVLGAFVGFQWLSSDNSSIENKTASTIQKPATQGENTAAQPNTQHSSPRARSVARRTRPARKATPTASVAPAKVAKRASAPASAPVAASPRRKPVKRITRLHKDVIRDELDKVDEQDEWKDAHDLDDPYAQEDESVNDRNLASEEEDPYAREKEEDDSRDSAQDIPEEEIEEQFPDDIEGAY